MSIAAEWILANFWISSGSGFWFVFLVHFWLSSGVVLQNNYARTHGQQFLAFSSLARTDQEPRILSRVLVGLPWFG